VNQNGLTKPRKLRSLRLIANYPALLANEAPTQGEETDFDDTDVMEPKAMRSRIDDRTLPRRGYTEDGLVQATGMARYGHPKVVARNLVDYALRSLAPFCPQLLAIVVEVRHAGQDCTSRNVYQLGYMRGTRTDALGRQVRGDWCACSSSEVRPVMLQGLQGVKI